MFSNKFSYDILKLSSLGKVSCRFSNLIDWSIDFDPIEWLTRQVRAQSDIMMDIFTTFLKDRNRYLFKKLPLGFSSSVWSCFLAFLVSQSGSQAIPISNFKTLPAFCILNYFDFFFQNLLYFSTVQCSQSNIFQYFVLQFSTHRSYRDIQLRQELSCRLRCFLTINPFFIDLEGGKFFFNTVKEGDSVLFATEDEQVRFFGLRCKIKVQDWH